MIAYAPKGKRDEIMVCVCVGALNSMTKRGNNRKRETTGFSVAPYFRVASFSLSLSFYITI